MQSNNYADCRVSVFRQVSDELFDWYRMATQDELKATGSLIIVDEQITDDELWERLEAD